MTVPRDDTTELRPIPGYPTYFADREGGIWSNRRRGPRGDGPLRVGPVFRLKEQKRRYCSVRLYDEQGEATYLSVHRLILLAFVGPPPAACTQTRHLNRNTHDNRLANLAWGTPVENADDQVAHGTRIRGSRVGTAVLVDETVREIRRLLADGWEQRPVARKFGISQAMVSRIFRREAWAHIV
jgi:hypothetical protein